MRRGQRPLFKDNGNRKFSSPCKRLNMRRASFLLECERSFPTAFLSNLLFRKSAKQKGMRMARFDSGLPHENPCAQCGKPIAAPDWIENGPRRISYLWHCRACDYRFEAVAFFDASHPGREAIAA
jgi:hypothetical protein